MSLDTTRAAVEQRLDKLGAEAVDPITLGTVAEIVEDILASIQGDAATPELQLSAVTMMNGAAGADRRG